MSARLWGVYEGLLPGEVHVAPVLNELEQDQHEFDVLCGCNPEVKVGVRWDGDPYFLVVHMEEDDEQSHA